MEVIFPIPVYFAEFLLFLFSDTLILKVGVLENTARPGSIEKYYTFHKAQKYKKAHMK